jgi:hypothetical protein
MPFSVSTLRVHTLWWVVDITGTTISYRQANKAECYLWLSYLSVRRPYARYNARRAQGERICIKICHVITAYIF